jgi:hypothetical protein
MSSTGTSSPYDADAADAAKYLDQASSDSGDGSLRDLVLRHLAATQGVGFAVLAAGDRLGEVVDAVLAAGDRLGEVAGAAEDANRQLAAIADAVAVLAPEPRLGMGRRLSWRLWGRRLAERAWRAEAGTWLSVDADDASVLVQALADAARLRETVTYADCIDCVRARAGARADGNAADELELCDVHARNNRLSAAYAALRFRLLEGAS